MLTLLRRLTENILLHINTVQTSETFSKYWHQKSSGYILFQTHSNIGICTCLRSMHPEIQGVLPTVDILHTSRLRSLDLGWSTFATTKTGGAI